MPDAQPNIKENVREVEGGLYKSIGSTNIATGVTNQAVDLAVVGIVSGSSFVLVNKTSGTTLKVRLGDVANDIIEVDGLESVSIDGLVFDSIYLSNDSGVTISYKLVAIGQGVGA